jgi:catechol 2,3-dioxygenase-like lactoylglutathione lyase family enzyme
MDQKPPAPVARLTMITLGVSNMRASIAFYEALGFTRKFRATGDVVAFFETGGTALGLFPGINWRRTSRCPKIRVRKDFAGRRWPGIAGPPKRSMPSSISAVSRGASLLKPAHQTDYGGYSGYFADPDNHAWEVVVAPGIEVGEDRRVRLPD